MVFAVCGYCRAQQDTSPIQGNAGQASQPGGVTGRAGNAAASKNGAAARASDNHSSAATAATAPAEKADEATDTNASQGEAPRTILSRSAGGDDNPYDPLLETPALPKGKPTLIGGTATRVDHVRNWLTLQPFGGGPKVKMILDERTHIYRNGAETTVLGIQKGDRVYADTMLDGAKVFAKNVRVINETGSAEVRGQVTSVNAAKGTVTLKDELSSQPITFAVDNRTRYGAVKGTASSGDVETGSLIDVQFAPGTANKRDVAQEITLLAKPGDTYVFAGQVTHIDMRSGTVALENRSDEQTYELHFEASALDDRAKLKVGSEVTAHAVFDGKQYKANDLQVQETSAAEESKDQ